MRSPARNIPPQVKVNTNGFLCLNFSGHVSTIVVTTVSMSVNWVPKPRVMSIKKKSMAHTGDIGNFDTASGYATNASPAPKRWVIILIKLSYLLKCFVVWVIPWAATWFTSTPNSWAMNPIMLKMTKPAKTLVAQLPKDMNIVSL